MIWYKKGLRFKCTGCGKCCTGSPGYVWVSDDEVSVMAEKLDTSVKEFLKSYTHLVGDGLSLL